MRKVLTLIFLIISVIFTAYSCNNDNGIDPKETLVDPSAMTWTIDTLYYRDAGSFQTVLNSIYVVDSNNVWVTGHCDINRAQLWKYSNSNWHIYNLFNDIVPVSFTPYKIVGSSTGLKIVGNKNNNSLLLSWSNNKWNDINTGLNSRMSSGIITSSGLLIACGDDGVILSYNGSTIVSDTITIKNNYNGYFYSIPAVTEYNNEKYIIASYAPTGASVIEWSYYFLKGSFKQWNVVDSFKVNSSSTGNPYKFGSSVLYSSSWGRLYSCGYRGLWVWNNSTWENQLSTNSTLCAICGAREDYVLVVGVLGSVYFYNGNSWKELTNIVPNQREMFFRDVWTDGKTIYIVANINGNKTLIIKGKKE